MLMERAASLLAVVDVQEKLAPVMDDPRQVIANSVRLVKAAKILDVPALVTEQYPDGLGPTMIDLRNVHDGPVFEKIEFSAWRNAAFAEDLKARQPECVVIAGIEAHICVLQTAVDLTKAGYRAFVVEDAVSSRRKPEMQAALRRMVHIGIEIVTTEMVLFEWLEKAGSDDFRTISSTLIR